jgi:hypothetical protein
MRNNAEKYLGLWVAVGIGMGTALGVALHNLGVWIGVGAAFGVAIGSSLNFRKK